ncbi:pyridoxamine 5'-phosphate oxidase family protein [Nocardia sp. 2]|uniref:Pyridoxamine 5'-phosphate oxidase family protein n=1 Tax=Nocardia acididurans TaxID=2802282 RepID=A0ABS1M962_9NOCA|nr:pyridoxamine 5'-phosphate oxidase family protein [Nocardia acididurans]MBL1077178.1 pyridoxamine 5'-phosphate oxidase family protein [Nocardia acididurans]
MTVTWPDEVDEILGGDLTAALAYGTPAGGAVVTAVAPIGLRDRALGTVGFTTSLGFGKKLERIKRNPKVALAFHAREHGLGDPLNRRYVLVQGTATFDAQPDRATLDRIGEQATPYLGAPRRGPFWDRWLSAYYADRVLVTVAVHRVVVWHNLGANSEREVYGEPLPAKDAAPQFPPAKGTGPRVDAGRAGRQAAKLPHHLLAYGQDDGFPAVLPVSVSGATPEGLRLVLPKSAPEGGRRAGLLSHSYRPALVGLETRQHTGWVEVTGRDALYAPHTRAGFVAPPNKTLLLLGNGFMARRGLKQATEQGLLDSLRADQAL